jgi:hypothetical protein
MLLNMVDNLPAEEIHGFLSFWRQATYLSHSSLFITSQGDSDPQPAAGSPVLFDPVDIL